jgi:DNA (cytosine-5)-methyltransferase 1
VPNLGDIKTVNWADVPPVDILTGGYPCQPFSHAGSRKGKEDERHLWPYVRDAIAALRPMVTVLENVDGHRSLGFADVLGDIAEMGMSARWGVVRAADAGAPHGRKRIFIIVTNSDGAGLQGSHDPAGTAPTRSDGHTQSGFGGSAADADSAGSEARRNAGPDSQFIRVEPLGYSDITPDADSDRCGEARGTAKAQAGRPSVADSGRDRIPAAVEWGQSATADADRDGYGEQLHTGGMGSVEWEDADNGSRQNRARGQSDTGSDEPAAAVEWGRYVPAIARWERVSGRSAPEPTIPGANGRPRLSPIFVEWMMGLPAGHVTGFGLRPSACLKILGNGVVPQQAALALRMLEA